MTARLIRMSEADYHADPCEAPSLSSSMAKILLDQSPAHAWSAHPKLGGVRRPATAPMDRGTLIHRLVLDAGADLEIIDAVDWRTKAAREARDAARKVRRIPVLKREHDEAVEVADKIRANLAAQGVVFDGDRELACVWQEQTASGPVWCRGLFDHLKGATITDLKTSRSAHPKACVRHVLDYGYDVQRAAYVRALERAMPMLVGRVDLQFAFVETEPPYACTVARLDGTLREYGERRWIDACETWASCLRLNSWPGYTLGPVRLEAPGWLMSTLEEAAE